MEFTNNITDPTYLRSIRDGLHCGSFQRDNAAALPDGLSGIYEQALPASDHPAERQRFLQFFGVWALLKKEVSSEFVSSVLEGWTEAMVFDKITRNSKWFNMLAGGRYALYHERLRSFLQQRISENEFRAINDAIIVACRQALEEKKGDEWEFYALEHLSSHLLLPAMETGHCLDLKTLVYDTSHWNRQIEISKNFEWSKRMLSGMMLWASKYDDEEVIECGFKMVDLNYLEQNAGSQIIDLFIIGHYEEGFNRLESFDPKTGFVLIILTLIELLEAKESIEINIITIKKIEEYMKLNFTDTERFSKLLAPDLIEKVATNLEGKNIKLNLLNEYINKDNLEWIEPISLNHDLGKAGTLGIVYNLLIADKMAEASIEFASLIKKYAESYHNIFFTSKLDLILLKEIIEKIDYGLGDIEFLAFLRGLRGKSSFYDVSYIFFNDYKIFKSLIFDIISYDEIIQRNQVEVRRELSEYASKNDKYILSEKLIELYSDGELDDEHYLNDYNILLLDLVEWKLGQNKDDDALIFIQILLRKSWGSRLDEAMIFHCLILYRKKSFTQAYEIINQIDDDEYKLKAFYALYFENKKQGYKSHQEDFIKVSISDLEQNVDKLDLFYIYKENSLRCFTNNWSNEFIEFTERMMSCLENDFYIKIALCDFYNRTFQKEKMELIIDDMINDYEDLKVFEKWILFREIVFTNRNKDKSFLLKNIIQLVNNEEAPVSDLSNVFADLVSQDFLSIAVPLLSNVQITSAFIKLNQRQVCQTIPLLSKDALKVKHLLQMHLLSCLFFPKDSYSFREDKIRNTLNLQWAIDIKNSLNDN
jgi:hypothetical protein